MQYAMQMQMCHYVRRGYRCRVNIVRRWGVLGCCHLDAHWWCEEDMARDHDHVNAVRTTAASREMRWKSRDASVPRAVFVLRLTGRWRGSVLRRDPCRDNARG